MVRVVIVFFLVLMCFCGCFIGKYLVGILKMFVEWMNKVLVEGGGGFGEFGGGDRVVGGCRFSCWGWGWFV